MPGRSHVGPAATLTGSENRKGSATTEWRAAAYRLPVVPLSGSESEVDSAAMKASCGTSTLPTIFMRFLPSWIVPPGCVSSLRC